MFGGTANRGDSALYNMLGGDTDFGRGHQRSLIGGPMAALAEGADAATIRGDYLDPESNPYLRARYDSAAGAVAAIPQPEPAIAVFLRSSNPTCECSHKVRDVRKSA